MRSVFQIVSGVLAGSLISTVICRNSKRAKSVLFKDDGLDRYKLSEQATNDAIWEWRFDDDSVHWNQGVLTMLGYPTEVIRYNIDWWRDHIHPDDRQRVMDKLFATFKSSSLYWSDQFRYRRFDGTYANVTDRAIIERDSSGRATRIIGAMTDISDLKKYQEQLESTNRALHQTRDEALRAARVKSEFLSNMSHEIRTPLNAIVGMSEVLLETDLDSEQKQNVELLNRASRTLLSLVNDILDFSRLEGKEVVAAKAPFDLHELVEKTLGMFSGLARKKGIRLSVTIEREVPRRVMGDENRVAQVFTNILGNALKFTFSGSVEVTLKRISASTKQHVLFCVKDTGVGIASEQLPNLFQRFTQADSGITKQFGGTGLGLAISKQLVEMMNGQIWVESNRGEGALFTFVLPFDVVDDKQQSIPKAESPPSDILFNTDHPFTILVVDDSPDNRQVINAYLKKTKCKIETAANGQEAFHMLTTKNYDLVLMDMQMPVMDGYTATREIRHWEADHGGHRIPIIALSAYAMAEETKKSIDAGCDAYLAKPVTKTELLSTLSEHLSRGH